MSATTSVAEATPFPVDGTEVGEVVLDIDYKIIEHFSDHLYGSPNKAVEELVSNGFDAFANRVYVYVPGPFTSNKLVVWDDGDSMDQQGLQALWWIARSPKEGDRVIAHGSGDDRVERGQIGKFGIGKLASYSVGESITHLCRRGEKFLLVTVDYTLIHRTDGTSSAASKSEPASQPILGISEEEARRFVAAVFDGEAKPAALNELFDRETWTLAVVADLKKTLTPGRLRWVLGNGMPLRPDFNVWVNDDKVVPRLATDAKVEWDFGAKELKDGLYDRWDEACKDTDEPMIAGKIQFGVESGLDPANPSQQIPYVELPNLGRVWGTVRIFDRSLIKGLAATNERSHGFFVYVRGRLLNADDDKLLLNEPSYKTFYSSQFILHADGLDAELLADRDRLRRESVRVAELRILQSALYLAARAKLESLMKQAEERGLSVSLLPTRSRELFREPLAALMMKQDSFGDGTFNLTRPAIERRPEGEEAPSAMLNADGFSINASHPYFRVLQRKLGSGKKAQEFYRAYDMFSISDRLLEGLLFDLGIAEEKAEVILTWKDDLLREIASNYEISDSDLAMELWEASFLGQAEFEEAIAKILRAMGFKAQRFGESGKKDGLLTATIGEGSYTFTFEGKGKAGKGPLPNDAAEIAGAASHRDEAGATHAVVVARKFAGFDKERAEGAAILNECRAVGGVSIMEVDAMIELQKAIEEYGYTLDVLEDVFTAIEAPSEKLARIHQLQHPTESFEFRELLDLIWEEQAGVAHGDWVAYRRIWQTSWRPKGLSFEDFTGKLQALEVLSGGRIVLRSQSSEVNLRQAPDIIVEQIERALEARVPRPPVLRDG